MLEASAEVATARPRGLWASAPAWRWLVVTAVLLTAAATALPLALRTTVLPAQAPAESAVAQPSPAPAATAAVPQPQVCLLTEAPAPTGFGSGTVISFEARAVSVARMKRNESSMGGLIDPEYLDNQRVTVRLRNGQYGIFIVPKSMQVHPGDVVRVQNLYRNVNLPCNYIPPLVTADFGRAADR